MRERFERAHTESVPDDASWLDGVVVPDDLRELSGDVEDYHRELRLAARRQRLERLTGTRAWQRFAMPIGVALCSLTLASAVFAILTLGHPPRALVPPRAPVASDAALPPAGEVGGLLPDVTVRSTAVGAMSVQDLRPALLALVPLHCDCLDVLQALAGQAAEVHVPLVVVAPANRDAEVDTISGQVHNGSAEAVFDLHGELASAYAASGVTIPGLRPDATVSFVRRDVAQDVRLEPWLQQMVQPVQSMSAR
jgi:hypothetical protein